MASSSVGARSVAHMSGPGACLTRPTLSAHSLWTAPMLSLKQMLTGQREIEESECEVWMKLPAPSRGNGASKGCGIPSSMASLPAASARSLPGMNQSDSTCCSSDERPGVSAHCHPASMLRSVYDALSVSAMGHEQSEADTSGPEENSAEGLPPFMLPSTLRAPQRPQSVRPLQTEGAEFGWQDSDSDSDVESRAASVPRATRDLSAHALAHLDASLRHALDSTMEQNLPPTARSSRPSVMYMYP